MHPLPDSWSFDGDLEKPTFKPSFRHTGYSSHGERRTCHYMLTAGILEFLSDSTHALAGKSLPLQAIPEWLAETNGI